MVSFYFQRPKRRYLFNLLLRGFVLQCLILRNPHFGLTRTFYRLFSEAIKFPLGKKNIRVKLFYVCFSEAKVSIISDWIISVVLPPKSAKQIRLHPTRSLHSMQNGNVLLRDRSFQKNVKNLKTTSDTFSVQGFSKCQHNNKGKCQYLLCFISRKPYRGDW